MCTNKLNNKTRRDAAMVIIARLKGLGFTQRDIALHSGIDESHITRIINGTFEGIQKGTLMLVERAECKLLELYAKRKK